MGGLKDIGNGKYANYLDWALAAAAKNPNFNEAVFSPKGRDYNYNLAYQNGDDPAANGHLSDIGKLLNHPTVSNESVSAIGNMSKAGKWVPSLGALVQPDSFLSAQRQEQAPWLYNNPSRGLWMAPEDAAYQPVSPNQQQVARLFNAFNGGK